MTPAKGGKKKKPRNANVNVTFTVNESSRSTVKRIEYQFPKKVKLDGTGFKTCSEAVIGQGGGAACPKKSQVGTGAATAVLIRPPDGQRTVLQFTAQVFVSGRKTVVIALSNTLVGTVPITATIAGPNVGFDIPARVQQPVPGLDGYVTSVTLNLGKQAGIPARTKTGKGRTRYFASLRGCSGGQHTIGATGIFTNNPNPATVPSATDTATSARKKK